MQLETFVYQFQASEDRNLSLFVSHILNLFVHNSNALSPEIDFDVHELVKWLIFIYNIKDLNGPFCFD